LISLAQANHRDFAPKKTIFYRLWEQDCGKHLLQPLWLSDSLIIELEKVWRNN